MGQYYNAIILNADGKIAVWMNPHDFAEGAKLTEHSYLKNRFVLTVESCLTRESPHYKSRVVWAGDYADEEPEGENLHNQCTEYQLIRPRQPVDPKFRYLVNHTKKLFVDKEKVPSEDGWALHPLPLLTVEGNGRGGGDYRADENNPLIGSWARDVISVEEAPQYEELAFTLLP
jgi:hypothetical protein